MCIHSMPGNMPHIGHLALPTSNTHTHMYVHVCMYVCVVVAITHVKYTNCIVNILIIILYNNSGYKISLLYILYKT